MVKIKKNSKRQKLSQKYNIEKKVREHRRKMRKTAKQTGGPVRKKHRRDPGIPNSCPFKQDILRTIQVRKQQKEAAASAERERRLGEAREGTASGGCNEVVPAAAGDDGDMEAPELVPVNPLAKLLDSAEESQARFRAAQLNESDENAGASPFAYELTTQQQVYLHQQQRQQQQLLRRVLQQADVIIEVLDARMPSAFRCPALERWVLGEGKKLILVMNKVDLVPKEAAVAWLKTLQRGVAPALAFKSAGGKSAGARKRGVKRGGKRKLQNWTDVEPLEASESFRKCSSVALGAPALLRLLNALAHTANRGEVSADLDPTSDSAAPSTSSASSTPKANLIVGVVGYPNVGKSSLVNALTHSCSAAAVAALPGSTKTLQFVRIDKHIQLIDSPGVLFSPSKNPQDDALLLPPTSASLASSPSGCPDTQGAQGSESCSAFILRSLLPVHRLENPQEVATGVAAWCCSETLQRLYRLEAFSSPQEMLALLAHRRGKLKKGGVPDLDAAAKIFLQDWQSGVIPYYTLPPSDDSQPSAAADMKTEKVAFWKTPAGEGAGDAVATTQNASSPAEVYASVLASQCHAIETGEDTMGETSRGQEPGVVRVSVDFNRAKNEPQRPYMLLRFGPVAVDSAKRPGTSALSLSPSAVGRGRDAKTHMGAESDDAVSAEASRRAETRKEAAAAAVSKKERMPHVVAMAKNKQAAKKNRKLANKLQRLVGEMAAGGDEDASMDEM
uniref:GTPase domain containing protein, putative n=1 Tax=Neospora caninum (strain Liverpool) TaxID=572307 RepID=A0A0F7UBD9_NEOCL|nr:TPA: GTPase domain containing protein, putative [Neospora caninum Liverpool]